MKINNIYKFANLFLKMAAQMSASEAAQLLNIKLNSNPEEIAKAYKIKALENHPDRGGSEEMMKKINEAKEVMDSLIANKIPTSNTLNEDPWVYAAREGREPDYEEIAEYRRHIGPEKFREEFPGLEMELRGELGLDEWNRIFEGYIPDYNPHDDPYYSSQQEQKEEWAASQIRDNLDIESLESRLESMTNEEKLNLVINKDNPELIEKELNKETGSSLAVSEQYGALSRYFSDSALDEIKNNVLTEAMSELIKYNKELFEELVTLKQIVESPRKFLILYNPKEHMTLAQIQELITEDFMNYIQKTMTEKFSHFSPALKEKYNIENSNLQMNCNRLASLLTEYYKSLGNDTYNCTLFGDIFKDLKNKNIFIFNKLIRLANPANYIG